MYSLGVICDLARCAWYTEDMIEFSPGPSQIYPKVPEYIRDALDEGVMSRSHRSAWFADMYANTVSALRELLDIPQDYHVWFLGSATEAMERVIQNTVHKSSHHFVNGAFSEKFATIAAQLGTSPTQKVAPWGSGFDLHREVVPNEAELIAITQNETSTGVAHNADSIADLYYRYPNSLLAVDIVSATPYMSLDFKKADCVFFSVQKGFGLPAGLGILVASPRALARAEELMKFRSIGSYHSFVELAKNAAKNNTPETPNVLAIYLLGRVVGDMLSRGADTLRAQLGANAKKLYAAINVHPLLTPAVADSKYRSKTVIVANVEGGAAPMIDALKKQGFSIGTGYADKKATQIRIANFPAHIEHVDKLVAAIANEV